MNRRRRRRNRIKIVSKEELKSIRYKYHSLQNNECPILKIQFLIDDMVVDHLHKRHAKFFNIRNSGRIRGVIHRQANSFEGKVINAMSRLGMHKFGVPIPELLRNLADYLERKPLPYLHPSEKEKPPILTKKSYNSLQKVYDKRAKFPTYVMCGKKPKQKMTKKLKELFELYGIVPEFYKTN